MSLLLLFRADETAVSLNAAGNQSDASDALSAAANIAANASAATQDAPDSASSQAATAISASAATFDNGDSLSSSAAAASVAGSQLREADDTATAAAAAAIAAASGARDAPDAGLAMASSALVATSSGNDDADSISAAVVAASAIAAIQADAPDALISGATAASAALLATADVPDTLAMAATVPATLNGVQLDAPDTVASAATTAASIALDASIQEAADAFVSDLQHQAVAQMLASDMPDALQTALHLLDSLSPQHAAWLEALARANGLIDPLTVSATGRSDGTLVQTLAEAGGTVTLTTTAGPTGAPAVSALTTTQATWLERLVRHHGIIDPLAVTDTGESDGTLRLSTTTNAGVTTVALLP